MIRQLRFFVLVGLAADHRVWRRGVLHSSLGSRTTAEERAAYESGERAGGEAPRGARCDEAELNTTAQKYFEQQGSAEQLRNPSRAGTLEACKQAFKKGYTTGFKKTHPQN